MSISRRALFGGVAAVAAGGLTATAFPTRSQTQSPTARPAIAASLSEGSSVVDTAAMASALPSASRNSVYTRGGAGPRYWTIYGWTFPHNAPIPESVWQQNIDWIAESLAPYGYDMASTDGWTMDNNVTDANGYVVSYNPSWTHDWAYWAHYLAQKKMKLGVYYNPLWVCGAAVNDPSKTVVGRPDIPLSAIVNRDDTFHGNPKRYWVDITKDGAKEYVQGYVNYFRRVGAAYLRIDFLAWYESGWDQNLGKVGIAHGSDNYATALSWMNEAAGDAIELSLVMPNLNGHAANEIRYGDMVRINDDVGSGAWKRLSGGRQTSQPYWTQWHNPFEGFTGFSDRSGRGQLILDGDFLLMNSFATDDERRTALNLYTMAGSPIAIADRVDNIGSAVSFYQNTELLALQRQGLVGKPFYRNGNPYESDLSSRDSERWLGQLPDATWVVGLFNRGDGPAPTTKSLDFKRDLGINGPARIRDVWSHTDLGSAREVSVALNPHASQLVTVVPHEPIRRYQAEFAGRGGGARFNNDKPGHSATGFVEGLDVVGANVVFAIDAPTAGRRTVRCRFANGTGSEAALTMVVEDVDRDRIGGPSRISFASQQDWSTWDTAVARIDLAQGLNLLTIAHLDGDVGAINLDFIELSI